MREKAIGSIDVFFPAKNPLTLSSDGDWGDEEEWKWGGRWSHTNVSMNNISVLSVHVLA